MADRNSLARQTFNDNAMNQEPEQSNVEALLQRQEVPWQWLRDANRPHTKNQHNCMRTIFICIMCVCAGLAGAQPLLLYNTGEKEGQYLLSRTYEDLGNYTVAELVICDFLEVTNKGELCALRMMNASVYRTKMKKEKFPKEWSSMLQDKASFLEYRVVLFGDTKLIFNNRVMNLGELRLAGGKERRKAPNKVKALEEQPKKRGVKPPANTQEKPNGGGSKK